MFNVNFNYYFNCIVEAGFNGGGSWIIWRKNTNLPLAIIKLHQNTVNWHENTNENKALTKSY